MTVGERIKQARKKSNMTQKELGDKLGVSASMVAQYENDLRNPKIETAEKIAHVLDVTSDFLLGRVDDPHTRRAAQDDYDRFDADSGNETLKQTAEDVERLTRERDEARSDCAADEQQNMALVEQIATLRNALSDMLFAYQNKDSDFPHQFKAEAVRKAKKTLERAFEQAQEQEAEK